MKPVRPWPPNEGYYTTSLVRNGPQVPVKIWLGHAIIDGEEQDRGIDWRCAINGATDYIEKDPHNPEYQCRIPLSAEKVWPWCAKHEIDEPTYRFMLDHGKYAREHAKHLPDAQPRKAIDRRGPSVF